jgi:hypothetical protein
LPISVSQLALPPAASRAIAPERTLDRARPVDFHAETEIEFLARDGIPEGVLSVAARRAIDHGTSPLQEMFALGFGKRRYWSMLADDLGVAFVDDLSGATLEPIQDCCLSRRSAAPPRFSCG